MYCQSRAGVLTINTEWQLKDSKQEWDIPPTPSTKGLSNDVFCHQHKPFTHFLTICKYIFQYLITFADLRSTGYTFIAKYHNPLKW